MLEVSANAGVGEDASQVLQHALTALSTERQLASLVQYYRGCVLVVLAPSTVTDTLEVPRTM